MNTKPIIVVVSIVMLLSVSSFIINTESSDAETDQMDISPYIGEYWAPVYTGNQLTDYEQYATIEELEDRHTVTVGNTTYGIESPGTIVNFSGNNVIMTEAVSFTVKNPDDSDAGSILFPRYDFMNRMDMDIQGSESTYCLKKGNISVSGYDFTPSTIYDALSLYHSKPLDLKKIGSAEIPLRFKGDTTITLPGGTYNFGTMANTLVGEYGGENRTVTIQPESGANVTVNMSKAEFQCNKNVSFVFKDLDFRSIDGCRLILNNNTSISIQGCSFDKVQLSAFGNKNVVIENNRFSGTGETINYHIFAMYVSESQGEIRITNNVIKNYPCGITIPNITNNTLPLRLTIESNTIQDLNKSDNRGVGIKISGHQDECTFDIKNNTIKGASSAIVIDSGLSGENSSVTSENNKFIGCDKQIHYSANDNGEVAQMPVTSRNDSAYDDAGTPQDIVISSDSGIVPPVASIVDPATETPVIPPVFDDDDDELPFFPPVYNEPEKDDESVKVVACAAAAVVVALATLFLMVDMRKR